MYCFKKLKLNSEFRRIYGRGKAFVNPAFVAYAFKGKTDNIRLGITVSKKIGGAVERNRAKSNEIAFWLRKYFSEEGIMKSDA